MPKSSSEMWHAQPRTLVKHRIIREYVKAWFAIMSRTSDQRFLVVDGFCGYGNQKQNDGTLLPGSPLIVLEELLRQIADGGPAADKQFDFLFVDKNEDAIAHLEKVALPTLGTLPANVNVFPHPGLFDDTVRQVLDTIGTGNQLIPSFVMVDPFSVVGIPMTLLHEILEHQSSEVLVTLMSDQAKRWLEDPSMQGHLQALFGAKRDEWDNVARTNPPRVEELVRFYAQRLSPRAKYVRNFRMVRKDGHHAYDLVFGTNSVKGLDEMKKSWWAVDPIGGIAFLEKQAGCATLFDDNPNTAPLRRQLLEQFAGQTVRSDDVVRWTITDTDYCSTHVKTRTLKPMEAAHEIEFVETRAHPPRRVLGQYPDGTKIRFRDA